MAMYRIQDADRPALVHATSYGEAVDKWKRACASEDDELTPEQVEDPAGVECVCDDTDLILEDGWAA